MAFNARSGAAGRREKANQTPSMEPGMGDDDIWGVTTPAGSDPFDFGSSSSDPFGSSSSDPFGSSSNDPFGASSNPFGGGGSSLFSPSASPNPFSAFNQQSQAQPQAPQGDLLTKAGALAAKGSWVFAKEVTTSVKEHNAFSMANMGVNGIKASVGVAGVGLAFWVLSFFFPFLAVGFYLVLGGLLASAVNLVLFATFKTIFDKSGGQVSDAPQEVAPDPFASPAGSDIFGGFDETDEDYDPDDDYEEPEEDDDWDDLIVETPVAPEPEVIDYDALMAEPLAITPHTQTRSYLFEQSSRALGHITPDYADMKEIPEGSDMWATIEEALHESCTVNGTKEENLPSLLSVAENHFVLKLVAARTPGIKVSATADELANIYSRDDYGNIQEGADGCFALSDTFGNKFSITIYKGVRSVMVSLKDFYANEANFVKDIDVMMPVIIGSSAEGQTFKLDFKKVTSCIYSGSPRMGKSWSVKAVLNQLATYLSPEEIEFHIGDPKGGISDFIDYDIPHVRRREFSPPEILQMLREITVKERERRMRIFQQYGAKEIFDLRARHPEVKMPFIYVVLDEMMTLASSLDKEQSKEYRDMLGVLVSQLPAYGIRGILIAHRVKDEIIPRSVYQLVPYRFTIGAVADEIKDNLAIQGSVNFPFKLTTPGDMGMVMQGVAGGTPVYARSAVLSKSEPEMRRYEAFIGKMWRDLLPDFQPDDRSSNVSRQIRNAGSAPVQSSARMGVESVPPSARRAPSVSSVKPIEVPAALSSSDYDAMFDDSVSEDPYKSLDSKSEPFWDQFS